MKNKFNTATFLRQLALTLLAVMLTATAAWADEEPKLSGSGTESDPYLITSAADWSTFASRVSGGDTYSGKYINLTADITVSDMVGTVTDDGNFGELEHPFSGTFNGCGHTLTFNLGSSDTPFAEDYAAPFRCVDGATFWNLHIDGEIKISKQWAAGLIGYAAGDIKISSCWSSVTITSSTDGDGTHAGFIAFFVPPRGSIYIENSLFDGKFVGENTIKWGGFVGWSNTGANLTNCLFAPETIQIKAGDTESGTFIRKNDPVFTITKCYYTNNTLGEFYNSVDASEMSSDDLVSALGGNFEVSNNKVVLKLTKGSGIETDPYIITTTAELDALSESVNSGDDCTGKYFKLGNDITYSYTGLGETGSNFTAIGSWDNPFKGNFDGDGKKISGIRIYKPDDVYQGLFGCIENANVENIILTDAKITGGNISVGGIAGKCNKSTIRNCIVDNVFVNGSSQGCGGIAGDAYWGTLVDNLIVNSTITVANPDEYIYTGAITGDNVSPENNYYYNCKVIVGETENTTGVGCGQNGTLPHDIDGARQGVKITAAEGITFQKTSNNSLTYKDQIYVGVGTTVTLSISDDKDYQYYTNGKGIYFTNGDGNSYNFTVADANDIVITGTNGDPSEGKISISAIDDQITILPKENAVLLDGKCYAEDGATVTLAINDIYKPDEGYTVSGYKYAEGEFFTKNADGNYTFTVPSENVTISRVITDVWGVTNKADGSEDHPYIITTPAGLNLLATKVNNGYVSEGKYFKLGDNITYSHENLGESESNFTAIGSGYDNSFNGNFDGDGYTISGIRIYKPNDNKQGLFGYIKGATIENIKLADALITGYRYIGGIAGYNASATINNCTVVSGVFINASKDDASSIGGIVGLNEDGVISKCTVASGVSINAGKESCYIGGIAGANDHSMGVSSIIENCISSATITVPGGNTCSNIGGIVGESYKGVLRGNLVINATIPAASDGFYGAIVGKNYDATLQNNFYYNTTVNGEDNATNVGSGDEDGASDITKDDGAVSVHTIQLCDGVTLSSEVKPTYTDNNNTNYYAQGKKLTLNIADGSHCRANHIVIDNNTFIMPAEDVVFALDDFFTITFNLNDGVLPDGIYNPMAYPAEEGSIDLPTAYKKDYIFVGWYDNEDFNGDAITTISSAEAKDFSLYAKWEIIIEITSADELIAFAASVNAGNDYSGKTVRLMKDIDFKPTEGTENNFTPIGVRTQTETIPFCGTFDGNGHTISGIRINQAGVTSACGLFSYIDKGATIQNVILSDIKVTGAVSAGLVALNDCGTIKHNFVNGATISGSEAGGAIVIDYGMGSIFENNYYYNCKVNDKTSNVGSMDGDIPTNDGAVHLDLIIDGDSEKTVSISETKENQAVNYKRTLTADIPTTIILPFDFTAAAFGNDEFYTFTGVDEKTWEATMTEVAKGEDNVVHLKANTPYIFKPSAETAAKSEFVFTNVTIQPTTGENTTSEGYWVFHGTYEKTVWNEDPTKTSPKTTTNVYGFAAKAGTNQDKESCEAGEFVRAGYNISIKPTRAYLEYKGTNTNLLKSALVLPDRIKVVFIDKETASVIDDPTVNPSENEDGDITTPTSEIQPTANVKVWSYDKTIYIQARPGTDYRIIDANGRLLRTATTQTDRDEIHLSGKADGIVIVNIGGKSFKIRY